MLKRIIKAVTVAVTIACLVVCMLPTFAFADVVEFTEAAKLGATIVDLYGAANNTSLAYESVSDGSAFTVIETLYQNYSTSASDPYTLAAIGAAAAAAGTIAVVYDAITGKGYVQLYQTQYVESLDGFWDYTLSDMGLSRNLDGLFEWSLNQQGIVDPIVMYEPVSAIPALPSTGLSNGEYFNQSVLAFSNSGASNHIFSYTGESPVYAFIVDTGSGYNINAVSRVSGTNCRLVRYNLSDHTYTLFNPTSLTRDAGSGLFYYNWFGSTTLSQDDFGLPVYSSRAAGLDVFYGYFANGFPAVVCEPEFYVGDPLTAEPTITVPDPVSPNYIPTPVRINTGIEWLPEWGNPVPSGEPEPGVPYPVTDPAILNDAVPDIWSSVVTGTSVEVEPDPDPDPEPEPDPDPDPGEVFNPLLPVILPSFNFSFSGIWHYVREWVSSLGSWFTTLFLIWSKLPYAMVVPVYATAVVVIVLGVYKRFFM